jgi:peptide/nickel transport system ATP-binding protein
MSGHDPGILLEIEQLAIRFGAREVVREVSFAVGRERVAIVGGSGAGKSTIGRAILRLLPKGATMTARRMNFDGADLLAADARALRALRGRRIGWVLQDAKFSLNPVMTAGAQIEEALAAHFVLDRASRRARSLELLDAVRLKEPERVHRLFPHELSGGMGQRAMIAMMLAGEPDFLVADEPTSALDAGVADEVLALLDALVQSRGMGLLFISHDLRLVEGFCDRVLVLDDGRIVESRAAGDLAASRHPYTQRLYAARPQLSPSPLEGEGRGGG